MGNLVISSLGNLDIGQKRFGYYPITKSPGYPVTQLPNYLISVRPKKQSFLLKRSVVPESLTYTKEIPAQKIAGMTKQAFFGQTLITY
ncbi:hypothetical protein H8E88_07655 [candidate division KSB1 bacterium]|nr:hypothetical protein [candidate division KSB1 bacterium]